MATRQRGTNSRDSSKQRPPPPSIAQAPFSADTQFLAETARIAETQFVPDQFVPDHFASETKQISRQQRIAISAYLRAAQRGFEPGHELEDWLAAEHELDADGASKGAFDRL